jgi:hypothetical protein
VVADARLPDRIVSVSKIRFDGCWFSTAYIGPDGHGRVRWQGRIRSAHRVAYEFIVGPILV